MKTFRMRKNPWDYQDGGIPHPGLRRSAERAEVERAINSNESNKETGPDEILVEAWRALGDVGVLWNLMCKIEEQEEIPEEWRESVLVPIFNGKRCLRVRELSWN